MTKVEKKHSYTEKLSSSQRSQLRGLAHHLKPVVQIGSQGLSENLTHEIKNALEKHELIKVQLPPDSSSQEKSSNTELLAQHLPSHCHMVGRIGRIVMLYLEKDPKEAKITLKNL